MTLEKSKIETLQIHPKAQTRHKSSTCVTFEDVNESYMDGCLPIIDPRVILLGCEGSGKTSLVDTLVGNSFQNTAPTEGADQMKISITTAANWRLMSDKEKLTDLNYKKQALLESEFFVSLRK